MKTLSKIIIFLIVAFFFNKNLQAEVIFVDKPVQIKDPETEEIEKDSKDEKTIIREKKKEKNKFEKSKKKLMNNAEPELETTPQKN